MIVVLRVIRSGMRQIVLLILLCLSTAGVPAQAADEVIAGCGDLAVIGRIRTTGESAIVERDASPDEWRSGWRNLHHLKIRIKQVVGGAERRRVVSATVVSHARIRDDIDFLIMLTPDGNGSYRLFSATPMESRPSIGQNCGSAKPKG